MITATEIKLKLASFIEDYGYNFPGYPQRLQALAAHVLALPDDDPRLVDLAAAYSDKRYTVEDFPATGNLQTRCGGFGPGLSFGTDPEQWLTHYVTTEIRAIRRLHG